MKLSYTYLVSPFMLHVVVPPPPQSHFTLCNLDLIEWTLQDCGLKRNPPTHSVHINNLYYTGCFYRRTARFVAA
jgi:hypothetical protein